MDSQLQKASEIVARLNEAAFETVKDKPMHEQGDIPAIGFGGSDTTLGISMEGCSLYDDQVDSLDDLNVETCRQKMVDYAEQILSIFRHPLGTKAFKLGALSDNIGAFGHTGHILVAKDGTWIEGDRHRSPINPAFGDLKIGDVIEFHCDVEGAPLPEEWNKHHFEFIKLRQSKAPQNVIDELWE